MKEHLSSNEPRGSARADFPLGRGSIPVSGDLGAGVSKNGLESACLVSDVIMEMRRWENHPEEWKSVRRGWCLRDKAFRKELLQQMSGRTGGGRYGKEVRESAEQKGGRIIAEELKRLRWKEEDLEKYRKGDRRKVEIARRLRKETTMTLNSIASRLIMGTGTHVWNRLYHLRK